MKLFRIKRKLKKDGLLTSVHYVVYVNNNEPFECDSRVKVLSHLAEFENTNSIFQLSVFRVECYSLIDKI